MDKKARYTLGSDLRNISREFVVSIARVNTMPPTQRLATMLVMFDLINQIYILLSRPNYCYCVIVCMTLKALKLQTFTKKNYL